MFSNIEDYYLWIDQELVEGYSDQYSSMQRVVTTLGQKQEINHLLGLILNNPNHLYRCVSQSYVHNNGFDKLVLLPPRTNKYTLRLHIWWPDSNTTIEDIHNHRANFSSILLTGAYRHQEFQFSDDGASEFYEYKFFPTQGEPYYLVEPVGKRKLKCVLDATLVKGAYYSMSHFVFHRVISYKNAITATLLLQGPIEKSFANVFSVEEIRKPTRVASPPLSAREMSLKIEILIATLQ